MSFEAGTTIRPAFIAEAHYFRGLAILFIVFGHALYVPEFPKDNLLFVLMSNLFQNGTALFVFISGFLFSQLTKTLHYPSYMKKKATNVLLPYILLSLPLIAERILTGYSPSFVPDWLTDQPPLVSALGYLVTGRHLEGYWFIPMILLFFLLAPIFHAIKDRRRTIWLALVLLPLSALLHRPPANVNPLQSFVYFLPVYLIGLAAGARLEAFRRLAAASFYPGLLAVVALSLFRTYWEHEAGLYSSTFTSFPSEFDLLLLQKTILCLTVFHLMRFLPGRLATVLGYLASVSFAIYFLHPFGLRLANKLLPYVPVDLSDGAVFVLVVTVCLASTLAAFEIAHALMGRRSRLLVGA